MSIIDPDNEIISESSSDYWNNELINTRILLNEINKAILSLSLGTHQSYELDTGQSRQRVTRIDLDRLKSSREDLLSQIHDLEIKLNINGHGSIIARPCW